MKEVSVKELADMIGVTTRRVQQLVSDGVFSKAKRGLYPVAENIQAYIGFMIRSAQEELSQIDEEELRLKRAQADIAEHKRDVMTGKYAEVELIHEKYRDQVLNMRENLLRLPRRLSLIALPPEPRAREIVLRRELNDALLELTGAHKNEDHDEIPDGCADPAEG